MAHSRSHSKHGFYACLPCIPPVSSEESRDTHSSFEVSISERLERLHAKRGAQAYKGGVSQVKATPSFIHSLSPPLNESQVIGQAHLDEKGTHRQVGQGLRPQSHCARYTWLRWKLTFKEVAPLLYSQWCFKISPFVSLEKKNPASLTVVPPLPSSSWSPLFINLLPLQITPLNSYSGPSPAIIQYPGGPV